jgi:hypothetical protein
MNTTTETRTAPASAITAARETVEAAGFGGIHELEHADNWAQYWRQVDRNLIVAADAFTNRDNSVSRIEVSVRLEAPCRRFGRTIINKYGSATSVKDAAELMLAKLTEARELAAVMAPRGRH